eukprot:934815-Pleurochrysis_carterae.AAC.1
MTRADFAATGVETMGVGVDTMGVGNWAAGLEAEMVLSCTAVLVLEMDGAAAFEVDVADVASGVSASLTGSRVAPVAAVAA